MTFIKYQHYNLRLTSLALIEKINMVIDEYEAEGYTPTLRQIYYQLVQANIIPNTQQNYDNLGVLIKKGRLMGLISWDAIEDRIRSISNWLIQPDQLDVVRGLETHLAFDLWEPQGVYLEYWVEKDAQVQVVERACSKYRVPYMQCRGYMSWSEIYNAGNRFRQYAEEGRRVAMIHLGDHDPSGWDMTRDNEERLAVIAGFDIEVIRIALKTEQVKALNLPPQWAKVTDKRYDKYRQQYGEHSWELDALKPSYISKLISETTEGFITDQELWDKTLAEEAKAREPLKQLYPRWDEVKGFLRGDTEPEYLPY